MRRIACVGERRIQMQRVHRETEYSFSLNIITGACPDNHSLNKK